MMPEDFEEIIINKKFSYSIQGYNPKQVERYLKKMSSYYWKIYDEKQELQNKIIQYEQQDKHFRKVIIRSEEAYEEIKDKAIIEANKIKQKAKEEAEQIRNESLKEAKRIKMHAIEAGQEFIQNLINNRKLYEDQTRELIGSIYYAVRSKINSLQEELTKELESYSSILESTIKGMDSINKVKKKNSTLVAKENWELEEEKLLVGYTLKDNIKDSEGNIIVSKSRVVTPEVIRLLVEKELYGELLTAIGEEVYGNNK